MFYGSKDTFENFYNIYYSLANFWILPSGIGRGQESDPQLKYLSKSDLKTEDYVDKFLVKLFENEEKYKETYPTYFKKIEISDFKEIHLIDDAYYKDGKVIDFSSGSKPGKGNLKIKENDACELVKSMIDAIEKRVARISKSCFAERLFDYFQEWNLVQ